MIKGAAARLPAGALPPAGDGDRVGGAAMRRSTTFRQCMRSVKVQRPSPSVSRKWRCDRMYLHVRAPSRTQQLKIATWAMCKCLVGLAGVGVHTCVVIRSSISGTLFYCPS
jgi:hypothetical protein